MFIALELISRLLAPHPTTSPTNASIRSEMWMEGEGWPIVLSLLGSVVARARSTAVKDCFLSECGDCEIRSAELELSLRAKTWNARATVFAGSHKGPRNVYTKFVKLLPHLVISSLGSVYCGILCVRQGSIISSLLYKDRIRLDMMIFAQLIDCLGLCLSACCVIDM